ncbi:hypothetical protein [Bacillus sp. B-jedd]|uniref:hypothetical protein n=1 Tax=Bacillus sp. B-jedd TaxID=1476857 RepID=UPI000515627B|nr:hypothetical protein [Bacillus sp. B-jedd]CEG27865.1 hypothetical protein BN1002_02738 [Bacillus sp. B-jedd]
MLKTNVECRPEIIQSGLQPVPQIEKLALATGLWISGNVYWSCGRTEIVLMKEEISLKIFVEQPHSKITMLNYFVCNHGKAEKQVKILAMQYGQSALKEHFAFVSPADEIVFHLMDKHLFLVDGRSGPEGNWELTVVPSWHASLDGIWGSKEKGTLKYNPMAKGNPASILSNDTIILPGNTVRACTWLISGKDKNELLALNKALLKNRLAIPKEK